jgi:hypothetical protein
MLLMMRSLGLVILVALSAQAGADGTVAACNFKIERDRVGALVLGQRISTSGQLRHSKEIELPGESPQVAKEVEFACGAKVLAILGSRSEVTTIIVQDPSISDASGIRTGMTFQQVRQKLPGARLYSGEEEGGYFTLGSGHLRYIFAIAGLPHATLSNQRELIPLAKSQALEEIRLILPAK